MSWIALSLTVLAMVLNAHKKIWCWPVGLVGNAVWITHFMHPIDAAGISVNLIMAGVGLFGWHKWGIERPSKSRIKKVLCLVWNCITDSCLWGFHDYSAWQHDRLGPFQVCSKCSKERSLLL